jgi:type I restriction enzyme, R subunit
VELTKKVKNPLAGKSYPKTLDTPAKRALYDNLGKDEALALAVDNAVRESSQDDWRENFFKVRKVKFAIKDVLKDDEELTERVLELVKNQQEY